MKLSSEDRSLCRTLRYVVASQAHDVDDHGLVGMAEPVSDVDLPSDVNGV